MGTETTWKDVGALVGQARRAAGLTQGQLAEQVGLDRTAVSKIESGNRKVAALELTRIADALDLPIDHFLPAPSPVLLARPLKEAAITDAEASGFVDALVAHGSRLPCRGRTSADWCKQRTSPDYRSARERV